MQTTHGRSGSAHVVVLGNEKGGSGKSTTALHIAVALMKAGQRLGNSFFFFLEQTSYPLPMTAVDSVLMSPRSEARALLWPSKPADYKIDRSQ